MEISNLLKNLKFKANALLNLVNLFLSKSKLVENPLADPKTNTLAVPELIFENISFLSSSSKTIPKKTELLNSGEKPLKKNDQTELNQTLNKLLQVYKELNDSTGQIFASQCLAYTAHTHGHLKKAIKYYLFNLSLCKKLNQVDNMEKILFNLSLCYKMLRNFKEAYKYQIEYFSIVNEKKDDYNRFVSLGIIAELLFEMEKSNETCQKCIEIHVDRLKIIKNAADIDSRSLTSPTRGKQNNGRIFNFLFILIF